MWRFIVVYEYDPVTGRFVDRRISSNSNIGNRFMHESEMKARGTCPSAQDGERAVRLIIVDNNDFDLIFQTWQLLLSNSVQQVQQQNGPAKRTNAYTDQHRGGGSLQCQMLASGSGQHKTIVHSQLP